jgi:hypothetical protein
VAVFATTGTLHLRLADSEPQFVCAPGVRVSYHRTVVEPSEDAPYGVETVTVTSPAGWLYYDEVDGMHTLEMGPEPVPEPPMDLTDFVVADAIMARGIWGSVPNG